MARRIAIRMLIGGVLMACIAWVLIWWGFLPEPPPCPVNQLLPCR